MGQKAASLRFRDEIERFCKRVQDQFQPDCIILHGSLARGTDTSRSDVDIVVIGSNLPANFLNRMFELNHLRDGKAPIEVVGYTLAEWEQMMANRHLTALEALQWGIPLRGQALFARWHSQLLEWKTEGLQRGATSWAIPLP